MRRTPWIGLVGVGLVATSCGDDARTTSEGGAGAGTADVASSTSVASPEGGGGAGGEPDCTGTVPDDDPLFAQAMDALRARIEEAHVPGAALAVIRDGEIVGIGVTGSKVATHCDPITEDSLFGVGFMSPVVTSIAALSAVDQGLLSLDRPIVEVIDDLSASTESNGSVGDITLHHLLTNTAMYRSQADEPHETSPCATLEGAYADPIDPVVQAVPGTMQDPDDHSSSEIAGLALERALGQPFERIARERVLDPLEMGGAYDTPTIEASDHAVGHDENLFEVPIHGDCPERDPSYGYHASIRDMARLMAYVAGGPGDLLEESTRVGLLETRDISILSDCTTTYGFTRWMPPGHQPGTEDIVFESSNVWGYIVDAEVLTTRGLAFITLYNAPIDTVPMNDDITQIYEPGAPPNWVVDYAPTPDEIGSALGTYRDELGFHGLRPRTLQVTIGDGGVEVDLSAAGESQALSVVPYHSADNYLVNGFIARLWRDDDGAGYALQIVNDNGPPFLRVDDVDMPQ